MKIEHNATVNALYLRIRDGEVAETVELNDSYNLDVDRDGRVLGAEFVNAGEFFAVLRQHGGHLDIPDQIDLVA